MAQKSDRRLSKLVRQLELRAVRPNTRETYLRCAGKFLDVEATVEKRRVLIAEVLPNSR